MKIENTFRAAVQTAAFFIAAAIVPAFAGTFQVTPVRVELSALQKTTALSVTNNGSTAVVIQLQSAHWAQVDGIDKYSPTDDLIATPPIFTILPGAMQVVRIGLRKRPDADTELSYRLYLQEVPPAPAPDFRGLQMALRISIPVFVEPGIKASGSLKFKTTLSARDQLTVTLSNQGKAHLQVTDFKVSLPGEAAPFAVHQVSSYLLPAQTRSWNLKIDPNKVVGPTARVVAYTDAGNMEADVTLDKP
jgi:fimbrial chaperone protein